MSHDAPGQERATQAVLTVLRLSRTLERVSPELTPQQYRILKLAGACGERSARLAERLAVAKPTLTAIADGLVAAGFARRDTEAGDRRVVRLCLTEAGRAAVGRADEAYELWLDTLLAQVADPDRVLDALDVLGQAVTELSHPASDARDGVLNNTAARPEPLREHSPVAARPV